jgi:hypothetical protein
MTKKLFATFVLAMGILIGASIAEAKTSVNGIDLNALSFNAFSLNGIKMNGIQVNGVSSEETHLLPLSDLAKEAIVEKASE